MAKAFQKNGVVVAKTASIAKTALIAELFVAAPETYHQLHGVDLRPKHSRDNLQSVFWKRFVKNKKIHIYFLMNSYVKVNIVIVALGL